MHTDPTFANADEFLKACRATMDRMEVRAPNIPEWIGARYESENIVPTETNDGENRVWSVHGRDRFCG